MNTSDVREGLFYTSDHLWIKRLTHSVKIGLTAYAQAQLNAILIVDPLWSKVGYTLRKDEAMMMIDTTIKTVSLYTPISGTVVAINSLAQSSSEIINSDPYEAGWLIELRPHTVLPSDSFMSASEYRIFIDDLSR